MHDKLWEIDPSKPFELRGRHGIKISASRCDFKDGFNIIIQEGQENHLTLANIVDDISEVIGYHAVNIRANFPPGTYFSGYGHNANRQILVEKINGDVEPINIKEIKVSV